MEELKRYINEFKIESIVSIDDEWKTSYELSQEDEEKEIRQYLSDFGITSDYEEKITDLNIETYKDLQLCDDPSLVELKSRVFEKRDISELKVIEELETFLGVGCTKFQSLEEIIEIPTKNSLVFIDIELEGTQSDKIIESIEKILEVNGSNNNIFIIYSHSETQLSNISTHELKMKYLEEKDKKDFLYILWGIKKTENFENFSEVLLENIRKSILGSTVKRLIEEKRFVEKISYEQLYNHGLEQINDILQDSFHEGEAPVETFKRFIKSIKKERSQNYTDNIINVYDDLSKIVNLNLESMYLSKNLDQDELKCNKLRMAVDSDTMVKSISNYQVNKTFSDIYPGDLFVINEDNIGVIISKECDSILRNNESGINRNNKSFKLLIMKKYDIGSALEYIDLNKQKKEKKDSQDSLSKSKISDLRKDKEVNKFNPEKQKEMMAEIRSEVANSSDVKSLQKSIDDIVKKILEIKGDPSFWEFSKMVKSIHSIIWPLEIDERFYCLMPTNNVLDIDSNILDLCSLSSEGFSSMKYDLKQSTKFKSFYSKKYFCDYFEDSFKYINSDPIVSYLQKDVDLDQLNCMLLAKKNSLSYNLERKEFSIKRVCRLQNKRMRYLLLDYTSKSLKPGLDGTIAYDETK